MFCTQIQTCPYQLGTIGIDTFNIPESTRNLTTGDCRLTFQVSFQEGQKLKEEHNASPDFPMIVPGMETNQQQIDTLCTLFATCEALIGEF